MPISYDFTLTDTADFTGTFSIDGASYTGSGAEVFNPDATVTGELFSFDITVLGTVFTMADDTGFPSFPRVGFVDGNAVEINYNGAVGTRILDILLSPAAPLDNFWTLTDSGDVIAEGIVGPVSQTAVSEPSMLALVGLGLALLAPLFRRSARAAET
jgi:hypothetical protein